MKKVEDAKFEGHDDVLGDKYTHPAYGMVRIGQISGQATLVGSAVQHQHFVCLEISEAEKRKDEYREDFFARQRVCEIYLSHAQLAEMLFSSMGSGVPCTIQYVAGDKDGYRPEPPFESPLKQNTDDLHAVIRKTLNRAAEMAQEVEAIVKAGNMKKAERERVGFLALKIHQDINSNIHYAMKCVDEKTEKVVAHAKAEIESFVSMTFKHAGIEHIKEAQAIKLLEDESELKG